MTEIVQTPVVQENGNISLANKSGASIIVTFQNDDGTPRDVTGRIYYFEVDDLRILLSNGSLPSEKVLTFTRTQVTGLHGTKHNFVLLDETAGFELSDYVWKGQLSVSN